MSMPYLLPDTSGIISPALLVYVDLVKKNISEMIAIAGTPDRLRPHCKTHKIPQVTQLEIQQGILKHKAATLAEVEMLAQAGAKDLFLAYNLVGPNIPRAVEFLKKYPDVRFAATVDHPGPLKLLSDALSKAGVEMELLLDIDCGMHRTGIEMGPNAIELYEQLSRSPGLKPGGLHVYDGHLKAVDVNERTQEVEEIWQKVVAFRDELLSRDLPVPRIVSGGTPTFPVWSQIQDPALEMSPGTCVFHDAGYGNKFLDMNAFTPAAVLLTRVVSRPAPNRMTLDLGSKAVASDPPMGHRLVFPTLPDAKQILQNEEHLVLETAQADQFQPGDELVAIPVHICPTTALHKQVFVISEGKIVDRWDVTARDRWLTL